MTEEKIFIYIANLVQNIYIYKCFTPKFRRRILVGILVCYFHACLITMANTWHSHLRISLVVHVIVFGS